MCRYFSSLLSQLSIDFSELDVDGFTDVADIKTGTMASPSISSIGKNDNDATDAAEEYSTTDSPASSSASSMPLPDPPQS